MEREVIVQDKPVLTTPVVGGGVSINQVVKQLVEKLNDGSLVVDPAHPVSINIPR